MGVYCISYDNTMALNRVKCLQFEPRCVAIIGAGPAGSTLARLLGGAFRAVVVEKRKFLYRERKG